MPDPKVMTNSEFAKTNKEFQTACEAVGREARTGKPIQKPTKRQAAKWRQGRGRAFACRNVAAGK